MLRPEREATAPASWAWIAAWALLIPAALVLRPLLPVDETRYLSVAWEMWRRHEWLVPYLNGGPYSDKPPLFLWSILAGWSVTGVNQWWPRLLSPLYTLLAILLLYRLLRRLCPDRTSLALHPLPFLSGLLWITYSTLVLFDTLLTVWVLVAVSGVVLAWQGRPVQGWLAYGIGIGLGILTKGPVVLVHVLPVAALAPWWARAPRPTWSSWYAGLAGALVLGAGIGLSWALPAAHRGGPAYEAAILWKQTAGRMVNAFAHRRPWWWYLPLLPVVLFPWSVWPPLWRSLISRRTALGQPSRFALAWLVPGLALLSLISGKQVHYLLPLLPAFVILAAARTTGDSRESRWDMAPISLLLAGIGVALLIGWSAGKPSWALDLSPGMGILLVLGALVLFQISGQGRQAFGLALVSPVLVLGLHLAGKNLVRRYNLAPVAIYLKGAEESGHPIAYLGRYQGEFHFLGRLQQPFAELKPEQVEPWARSNIGGLVIRQEGRASDSAGALQRWPYRDGYITIRAAASLVPSRQ